MNTEAQVKQGPDIQNLLVIQRIDSEIARIRQRRKLIPDETKRISGLLKSHEEQLRAIQEELKQAKKGQHESEVEIRQKEEQSGKYQVQLHAIKTNREYEALLHEIEGLKADISSIEDMGLEQLARIEDLDEKRRVDSESLEKERAEVERKKSECLAEDEELKATLERKEQEKEPYIRQVDPELFRRYQALTENKKDANALAELVDDSCTGSTRS